MANTYHDATGVLILDRVTPVITALFGAFNLDETYPGNGQAYIARISESNDPCWSDVQEALVGLAADLGLALPDRDIETVLATLATHFGADQDEELENLIEHHSFEDDVDLDALFLIAKCFNDGHGLSAIQFEGCWYCNKPRLFEFGGMGSFLSQEVRLHQATRRVLSLGMLLREAVLKADAERASALIQEETAALLSGIHDDAFRRLVLQRLAERLTSCLA
jgi:hypothetical protein